MTASRELGAELYRRQRRRRAATTVGVLVLMLFFAFWYALSYYRANSRQAEPTSSASCMPFDPKAAAPANTTVNVYNSTTRAGLAGRAADELKKRGYTIGEVANNPEKKVVPGVAELRFAKGAQTRADLLVKLTGKGTTSRVVDRKGLAVDLVIGTDFRSLGPEPKPTGKPTCPSTPTPTPSPSVPK